LIDYCLFLATGGQRGRSNSEGGMRRSTGRPVGVITSIEGTWKEELQNRCVEVEYLIKGEPIKRGPIEQEITQLRDKMTSAIMLVLQRYFQIKQENRPSPNPVPQFEEHFTALANLLWAYGDVAGKPQGWAEQILAVWNRVLSEHDETENELEEPLREVLRTVRTGITREQVTWQGRPGSLHITTAERLLAMLRGLDRRDLDLPRNAQGLIRRFARARFVHEVALGLKVLCTKQPQVRNRAWGSLVGSVDIWAPLWPMFQEAAAKERLAAGEEIWSYTALCQGSPHEDTPFWELDLPLLNYRIPMWISWRFGITGLLYWSTTNRASTWDVWTNPLTYDDQYNMEGSLLYPGVDAGVQGLVASIRLKEIREGPRHLLEARAEIAGSILAK
jgi:hypothetical protein